MTPINSLECVIHAEPPTMFFNDVRATRLETEMYCI